MPARLTGVRCCRCHARPALADGLCGLCDALARAFPSVRAEVLAVDHLSAEFERGLRALLDGATNPRRTT